MGEGEEESKATMPWDRSWVKNSIHYNCKWISLEIEFNNAIVLVFKI